MQVSINQLQEMTGKSYRTIKKKIEGLKPVGKGRNRANLFECVDALEKIYYIPAAQGDGDPDKLDLSQERALLAREQRKAQEIKNAEAQKILVPFDAIMERVGRMITAAKTQFLALPDRVAQMLETCETFNDRRAILDAEVKLILNTLADGGKKKRKDPESRPKPKPKKKTAAKKKPTRKKKAAKKKKGVKK